MASVAVIMITAWYNELGGSGNHWFIRNLLNGIGFGAFETGATLLADFKDVEGDIKIKRSTVPLDNPRVARPSVLLGLIAWSMLLSHIWCLDLVTGITLGGLGSFVGVRFCTKAGRRNDQVSFYWYNVSIPL
ncbi:hypothetical protein EIP86_006699 [Pleurotus ostreatoroseus]|nr:hypothetical protein EIP86_006699 [Pleurotus ostreatoroseus]